MKRISKIKRLAAFCSLLVSDLRKRYAKFCSLQSALASGRFTMGAGATFVGQPEVILADGAFIHIAEGVELDSSDPHYHLNAYAGLRLIAGKPGAKILIGRDSRIHSSCIRAEVEVVLGDRCLVAANCQIMDSNGHPTNVDPPSRRMSERDQPRPVRIGDDVWLGTGVVVLPGVSIGCGSVIGANSVVATNIPEYSLAVGLPAKVIRSLL